MILFNQTSSSGVPSELRLSQLIRLTYASTTASTPATIREDLVQILDTARAYNVGSNIHGVLFYGNNYFFQCLEGDEKRVDQLYQKILKDSRHKNVVLLTRESIREPKFNVWDMKYVMQEVAVKQFFNNTQWEKFNPYVLTDELIQPFLNILYGYQETIPGLKEQVESTAGRRYSQNFSQLAPFLLILIIILLGVFLWVFKAYNNLHF